MEHGVQKNLVVVKEEPRFSFMSKGNVLRGMWDTSNNGYGKPINKWYINYNNGFHGWWPDEYFDYEGKEKAESIFKNFGGLIEWLKTANIKDAEEMLVKHGFRFRSEEV